MVDFTRKRLQVFVSSTYTDLKQERQAAVEAILSHGHIPAGMELFISGDESQLDVIKQWIDESDVYLLILGGRYGSIEPKTNKSYTHLEYEYALETGKPYFACVVNEQAQKERIKQYGDVVIEDDNPKELKTFRKIVESKIVKYWSDCKDIKIVVGETMGNFARREDLIGWVRSNQLSVNPAIAEELARLSKENEQLRTQLANSNPAEELINGFDFSTLKTYLTKNNLFDIFIKNKMEFNYGIDKDTRDLSLVKGIEELCIIGVVKFEKDKYLLSDSGRLFINKIEIEKLKLKKESVTLNDNKTA
ncbi:MAG: DUF4062 domain-containing protein [Methylococcaceae bacterium]